MFHQNYEGFTRTYHTCTIVYLFFKTNKTKSTVTAKNGTCIEISGNLERALKLAIKMAMKLCKIQLRFSAESN